MTTYLSSNRHVSSNVTSTVRSNVASNITSNVQSNVKPNQSNKNYDLDPPSYDEAIKKSEKICYIKSIP